MRAARATEQMADADGMAPMVETLLLGLLNEDELEAVLSNTDVITLGRSAMACRAPSPSRRVQPADLSEGRSNVARGSADRGTKRLFKRCA